MFDLNWWPILWAILVPIQIKDVHSSVHTNRQPIKNLIGVVMNRLVGMSL